MSFPRISYGFDSRYPLKSYSISGVLLVVVSEQGELYNDVIPLCGRFSSLAQFLLHQFMNIVLLKNFAIYPEAEMSKELLEKSGIKCMLQKGNLAAGGEFTGITGDATLFVSARDYTKAKEILDLE